MLAWHAFGSSIHDLQPAAGYVAVGAGLVGQDGLVEYAPGHPSVACQHSYYFLFAETAEQSFGRLGSYVVLQACRCRPYCHIYPAAVPTFAVVAVDSSFAAASFAQPKQGSVRPLYTRFVSLIPWAYCEVLGGHLLNCA